MKKSVLVLLVFVIPFACKKNKQGYTCPEVTITAPASEIATLQNYIYSSGITATQDPRGFFYNISTAGWGDKPDACSVVTVDYVGKLTNGNTFDSNTNTPLSLDYLIAGWREGLPLISAGGKITLYLPPSLGYGSSDYGDIPGNSILIFVIDLKNVN